MKIIKIFIVVPILIILLCSIPVAAFEEAGIAYSSDEFGVEGVLDLLPGEARSALPENDIFEPDKFTNNFGYNYFFNLFIKAFFGAVSPAIKMFSVTMGILLVSSALSKLKDVFNNYSVVPVFEIVSRICIMLALYSQIISLVKSAEVFLSTLSNVMGAMMPAMLAMGIAGGDITAATVGSNGMMLVLTFVEALAKYGLFPVLEICFGLAVVSGMGGGLRLNGISGLVRGTFGWLMALIAAIISTVMTFQTSIARQADSVALRAARFAASKVVPVAGNIAGEAVSAVAGSLTLIRRTAGYVGIIIIAVLLIPVIANILLTRLGVSVSSIAADIIGLDREKGLLDEFCGLLGYLAAICVIAALMFIYGLAIFAKSSSILSL